MIQEFLHGLRNQGVPTLMGLGCIRLDVFIDASSTEVLVTTMWPTREAAEVAPQSTPWKELRSRLDETFDGEPSVRIMYRASTGLDNDMKTEDYRQHRAEVGNDGT
jgi:hypothetical protein